MNYQLIKDEAKLLEFIEWLPVLKPHEKYYVSLFARKKYCNNKEDLKADKCQLKRFVSNKERLYQKIKQLEVEVGSYQFDGIPVPPESLALYITVNPRDIELATKRSLIEFAKKITEEYSGYEPQSLVLSSYQKSCSSKYFMDFDFDDVKYEDVAEDILGSVNIGAIGAIIKTRGGFHLLISQENILGVLKKTWYQNITKIKGCDVRGDSLVPIPGCIQGDFVPKRISRNIHNNIFFFDYTISKKKNKEIEKGK